LREPGDEQERLTKGLPYAFVIVDVARVGHVSRSARRGVGNGRA
jgi:hypothetical protein